MKLLLTSFLHERLTDHVSGTVAYVPDAVRAFGDAPWTQTEREVLRSRGLELVELPLADTPPEEVDRILGHVDAVYVAGGDTFDLLHVLRSTGTDAILTRHVRAGLTYIGCSAGSVIAGPDIEPCRLLDDPATTPELTDYTGLGFTDLVVVPHAQGSEVFPIEKYADTVRLFGERWPLVLLRDGQALLIEDGEVRLL
ncbi:Type 1 glutamine amidotransferase-like domain-containing protein [Corynebacterium sp.]|uniref:Type 1 glutamine amidotransferase-like domain-containing protein n=1 Tax=Corynebacterium sp. TaxID=1720 RepID=UPI0026E01FB5|nr:Type 1 glutamine amidotransferase-like domain-containing protein [Corynebacterium sp.]MDO5512339.1 Type 1 glutamine amidotransferase-like domain-containing protein [Corynebacterium sp.]